MTGYFATYAISRREFWTIVRPIDFGRSRYRRSQIIAPGLLIVTVAAARGLTDSGLGIARDLNAAQLIDRS